MLKIKRLSKTRIIFIVIAIIHFASTFFTDTLYFEPISAGSEHIVSFVMCKILLFVVLMLFWKFIYQITFARNKYLRNVFKYSMLYFIPMMMLLAILWPGALADGDISYFINHEVIYSYNYFLHYFTSLVHLIGLMIFPFISGILIFQSFCYSLIVGYIVNRATNFFQSKFVYLIYAIFLIPSTAYFSLYINRTPIYGYIYLLFLAILIFDFLEKQRLTIGKMGALVLLASILAVFRYEGIYLILTTPILIAIAYPLEAKFKSILLLVLAIVICIQIISIPQKKWENKYQGNFTYKRLLPTIVHSMSNMLKYNIKGDFEIIDKVVSVDIMKEHADIYNITPFSKGVEREGYSSEEEDAFIKESLKIFATNLPEFLKVRFETFHITSLYSKDSLQNFAYFKNNFAERSLFTDELFPQYRDKALKILVNNPEEGQLAFESQRLKSIGKLKNRIFYNLYIPIGIILLILIVSLIKVNWFWILITLGALAHVGIIFLLAPAAFFIYYLPISMVGWFIGVLFIIGIFTKTIFHRKEDLFG